MTVWEGKLEVGLSFNRTEGNVELARADKGINVGDVRLRIWKVMTCGLGVGIVCRMEKFSAGQKRVWSLGGDGTGQVRGVRGDEAGEWMIRNKMDNLNR